jgi:glycosyltransferase involved in cell wall biosynthesis
VLKRRVLHIINGEHYAGAERVQDLLAARLPEFGYEAGFACVCPGIFDKERLTRNAPLVATPMANRLDIRPALRLTTVARRENYHLIHTHTTRSAIIGAIVARWAGLPMVHHLHGPTARSGASQWLNRTNIWLEGRVLPRADAVIAVSRSLEGYARQLGLKPDRVTVIPNGVPTPGPLTPRAQPEGCWIIGIVALFRPGKGLEVLLDALHHLLMSGRNFRLLAVGPFESPTYRQSMLDRANRLELSGRISWLGFQKNVQGELSKMDLLVLPSLSEGMPMILLEAMAAGVPLVSTRIDGVSEVIRDGVDGLLATPGDAVSLADRIRSFFERKADWNAMRYAAYQRQVTCFSDTVMAKEVAHVYDDLLGPCPNSPS